MARLGRGDAVMQFAFEEPAFGLTRRHAAAQRVEARASQAMTAVAEAMQVSLQTIPPPLAVEAAVACGMCRLSGGFAPQVVFPTWLATAAAHWLVTQLDQATGEVRLLPEMFETCSGRQAEQHVASLLRIRMDAWAAALQFDDVMQHVADRSTRPALEAATEAFEVALERFDRSLAGHEESLSIITGTALLDELRDTLAPDYRDPLPWWLDGTLEAAADRIDTEIDDLIDETLPEP